MLRILEDPGKEEKQRNRKNVGILTSWGEFSIHRERKKNPTLSRIHFEISWLKTENRDCFVAALTTSGGSPSPSKRKEKY
jgi:hypothetical protein